MFALPVRLPSEGEASGSSPLRKQQTLEVKLQEVLINNFNPFFNKTKRDNFGHLLHPGPRKHQLKEPPSNDKPVTFFL